MLKLVVFVVVEKLIVVGVEAIDELLFVLCDMNLQLINTRGDKMIAVDQVGVNHVTIINQLRFVEAVRVQYPKLRSVIGLSDFLLLYVLHLFGYRTLARICAT